jgi:hypothetical protein
MISLSLFDNAGRPTREARARRSDPQTSHDAAARAGKALHVHYTIIRDALRAHGPMVPSEIERVTELDYHQIQRRGKELEEELHWITRGPEVRDDQKVWKAA